MPYISKITLPSNTTYDIKDEEARQMISGGISFNIAWDGNSIPSVASIPAGVVVTYNGQTYTGTLDADDATPGAFYLVKSASNPSSEVLDIYDEYVPVGDTGSKTWEKLGDTKVDLSDVVTGVTLNKQTTNFVTGYGSPTTATVVGTNSTFSVTQPTISVVPSQTYLGASASGANTAWNAKDSVTAVTGYPNTTSDTFVKSVSAETGSNMDVSTFSSTSVLSSVTDVTSKLVTTTVTGVSGSTTASKATAGTSQTTAIGTGTSSSTNTDWLKGVSVTGETLKIGAATMDTQTTTQYTFSNVTVPTAASSATTVATGSIASNGGGASVMTGTKTGTATVAGTSVAAGNSITFATGSTSASGEGSPVVTGITIGSSGTALTSLGSPSTKTAIGSNSTFTITQPTVTLASNSSSSTGRVQVATGITSATATNGAVAWNDTDSETVIASLGTPSTSAGLNNSTTISVTKGNE